MAPRDFTKKKKKRYVIISTSRNCEMEADEEVPASSGTLSSSGKTYKVCFISAFTVVP